MVIDCGEPIAANLFAVENLQAFLEKNLQRNKPGKKIDQEPAAPSESTDDVRARNAVVPTPRASRCGHIPQSSHGGIMTPRGAMTSRATPRPTTGKSSGKASTPRINTKRSIKAGTPRMGRARAEEAAKEKKEKEAWGFKVKGGTKIKATIPMQNGRRLLESMVRRFLQKESLMARIELRRAVTGGIEMRVDPRTTIRELDQILAEEEREEVEAHLRPGVSDSSEWGMPLQGSPMKSPVGLVSPLRFDRLQNLERREEEEEDDAMAIDIPTMQVYSPSKTWLSDMEHPLQVTPTKPDCVSPTHKWEI